MKFWKKLSIFVILTLVFCMTFALCVSATESIGTEPVSEETVAENASGNKLDMNEKPEPFSARAFELALQGTITGMLMVFAVLSLLAIIVSLSKYVLNRNYSKDKNEIKKAAPTPVAAPVPESVSAPEVVSAPVINAQDDSELAAVITAAIAVMIESGDYKNEFVGGFRVVSFKRTSNGAWNRK